MPFDKHILIVFVCLSVLHLVCVFFLGSIPALLQGTANHPSICQSSALSHQSEDMTTHPLLQM